MPRSASLRQRLPRDVPATRLTELPSEDRRLVVELIESGELIEAGGEQFILLRVGPCQLDALAAFAADLDELEATVGEPKWNQHAGMPAGPNLDQTHWCGAGLVPDDAEEGHDAEERRHFN